MVIDDQYSVSPLSKYVSHFKGERFKGERRTVDAVLEIGSRFNLANRCFSNRDETVAAFVTGRAAGVQVSTLSGMQSMGLEQEEHLRSGCTVEHPCPETFNPRSEKNGTPLLQTAIGR